MPDDARHERRRQRFHFELERLDVAPVAPEARLQTMIQLPERVLVHGGENDRRLGGVGLLDQGDEKTELRSLGVVRAGLPRAGELLELIEDEDQTLAAR